MMATVKMIELMNNKPELCVNYSSELCYVLYESYNQAAMPKCFRRVNQRAENHH